jgi:hypothetical protein
MFNSTFLQIFIKNFGLDPGRVSRIPAKYLHHRIRIRNNAYKEISLFSIWLWNKQKSPGKDFPDLAEQINEKQKEGKSNKTMRQ